MNIVINSMVCVLPVVCAMGALRAQVVADDFDDGDDLGWTRLAPLEAVGGSAHFSFPGGGYQIASDASPNPGLAGPARAGAFRDDESYEAFRIEVDVTAWDNAALQDFGILARISSPGLGTLNGYAWGYETGEEEIYLSRVDGEEPTVIGTGSVVFSVGETYRLVLEGFGGDFCGQVFQVGDLENPLVTVLAFDDAYASGFGGVFNNAVPDGGTTDSTFDNYRSSVETDTDKDGMLDQWEFDFFGELFWFDDEDFDEDGATNLEEFLGGSDPTDPNSLPGSGSAELPILSVVFEGGELTLTFPIVTGRGYAMEVSPDLRTWMPQPGAVFADNGATGSLRLGAAGGTMLFGRVVESSE